MQPNACISLLTRLPVPGQVKSRLIPELGAEGAAALQREMAEHVASLLRILAAPGDVRIRALVAGGSPADARRWLRMPVGRQAEGDLGIRQAAALRDGLRRAPVAAVIGGDCPTVPVALMREAIALAEHRGAAIVAADDGGYCMLAVSSRASAAVQALETAIDWGTSAVLEQCIAAFLLHGVQPAVLGPCADIDEPADLAAWASVRRAWYEPPKSLAVIVPVLNEAPRLPALVRRLRAEDVEVIVADGGSVDGSRAAARAEGAVVVKARQGRAPQLNAGAAATQADALLFLHADTTPPRGFASLVLDDLAARPGVAVGAFRFSLAAHTPLMRLVEAGTRLRGSLGHMPYGDQALYCRRAVFEAFGGFPPVPVMEDYEFVVGARRAGSVRVLAEEAVTSDRRWVEHGALRWTALNLATVVRHRMGVPADELAAWRAAHSKR